MAKNIDPEKTWARAESFLSSGKPLKALPLLKQLYAFAPDNYAVCFNLGACLFEAGNFQEAETYLAKSLAMAPGEPQTIKTYAFVLANLGKFDEAISYFEKLRATGYYDLETFVKYGATLSAIGNNEAAIEVIREGLLTYPNDLKLITPLSRNLSNIGKFTDVIHLLEETISPENTDVELWITLSDAHQNCGNLEQAQKSIEKALRLDPAHRIAQKKLKFIVLNQPHLTSNELFETHTKLADQYNQGNAPKKSFGSIERNSDRPLRIGYVSSDFRIHVVAFNLLPLTANHNHQDYSVFFYSDVEEPDQITSTFESQADQWRPIRGLSDSDAAKLIKADKIDILVFLAGRFDENRPEIAAYRPAPIQISYHDCATSGLKEMDYWLTDDLLHPASSEEKFTETLFHLPIFYQYDVPNAIPDIGASAFEENGYITFGCLNKPEKINSEVIELWSNILASVHDSRLLLKYFNHYIDPTVTNRINKGFAEHGIEADRIIFGSGYDVRGVHLTYLDKIDICLDPFPFNGATTTFEALSMGVPVIALWGHHFVDRVAGSLLTHAGLTELVLDNKNAYSVAAIELATDLPRLKNYKATIRDKLFSSPLCKGAQYAKNIENAYRKMWQDWCNT